jgi:hypothetical protein
MVMSCMVRTPGKGEVVWMGIQSVGVRCDPSAKNTKCNARAKSRKNFVASLFRFHKHPFLT